jgi:O-antigen/teichoic acid export membrane protein
VAEPNPKERHPEIRAALGSGGLTNMNLIPPFIHRRIAHQPNLVKIVDNIGWLFLDRILRLGVGLIVGVWVARYLGPEQFGLLNYAAAFVTLFGAIAGLGLNGIVVRDLVKEPEAANTTLGTAFVLQLLGGLVAFFLVVGIISWLRPEDALTKTIVAILGFTLVLKASEVIKYWFESQVRSRYAVWVENSIFILMAAVRVALILDKAPLIAFVWMALVEAALVALGLFGIYVMQGGTLHRWSLRAARAKTLLKDSWPLALSGIAIMIYMRIDQIMLGDMIGEEAVGIYSAALRISEIWYMIPMIIVASLFPAIIESKKNSESLYQERMQKLLDLMATISILIAIVVTFSADWLILLLYGYDYAKAAGVLKIHIWTCVFVFLGVASGKWFLVEGLQRLAFYRTAIAACLNGVLNIFLISEYGVLGAAVATLCAQIFAAYLFDLLNHKTRKLFWFKTASLLAAPGFILKLSK